jgi:hypothetical protein
VSLHPQIKISIDDLMKLIEQLSSEEKAELYGFYKGRHRYFCIAAAKPLLCTQYSKT